MYFENLVSNLVRPSSQTTYSKMMSRFFLTGLLLFASLSTVFSQQFLVTPYIQPGDAHDLKHEQKVLVWQTDSVSGKFFVAFKKGKSIFDALHTLHQAKITKTKLELNGNVSWLYRAHFDHLDFDHDYAYTVKVEDRLMARGNFRTRTHHHETKFAVFGDCGTASPGQSAVAFQVYQKKPDFVLLTGDQVYTSGLEIEFRKRFFPQYAAAAASKTRGAPLMQSVPFYLTLGNHDVKGSNLREYPDGMAYFYYTDLPRNGPKVKSTPQVDGTKDQVEDYFKNTEGRFPGTANYSFRHGNVHVVSLDANNYVNPLDSALQKWIRKEFSHHKNEWRIVAYHHPGFNSSNAHYDYQQMRLLSPLLEELGVDLVLTGHVHNYQRSIPLKFIPEKDKSGDYRIQSSGRVNGEFILDQKFDGKTMTKPEGIIYVTTGAGGAQLYDAEISNKPEMWEHTPKTNWVPFTKTLISDKYSFTWVETHGHKLTLTQIDAEGAVLDQITVTR